MKSKQYNLYILVASIFVLLSLCMIYFVYKFSQSTSQTKDERNALNFTPSPTPTPDPKWTLSQTYITYENLTLGIKFDHPDNYEPSFDDQAQNSLYYLIPGPSQQPEADLFDGISISIKIEDTPNAGFEKALQALYENRKIDPGVKEIGKLVETSISGKKGFMFTEKSIGDYERMYFPLPNNKYLNIVTVVKDPNSRNLEIVKNKIIGSIQILI